MPVSNRKFKYIILLILFFSNFFVWYGVFAEEKRNELQVSFLDVGQGDGVFIEAPGGNQILVDGGRNKKVLRELSKVMPFYDRSIDVVIATHPDADHIGGLPAVLERFDVDLFVDPGNSSDTAVYKEMIKLLKEKNIEMLTAKRGMKINLDYGAYLLILFPDRDVSLVESNTSSIVSMLVYGNTSFLLTGDSPKSIENYLASIDGGNLKADVLKAGHHGSKTSTSELFLGYVNPSYAIISSGKNNSYGHPHKEVLDLLEKFEIKVIRTDESGAIIFKSDGLKVSLE